MDSFNTIRLKKKTIKKFKEYSKKLSSSYSETLDFMIAFFEDNNISPYDTLKMSNEAFLNQINKRMDAVVSIFRNIEEAQLKPTKKILESLFEEIEEKKPLLVEKTKFIEPVLTTENEELTYYRNEYYKKQTEVNDLKYKLKETFGEFKLVKNTFSANHYLLKLTKDEHTLLKDILESSS
ncbi:hypothetical protein MKD41_00305 [Lutibacter sp. A64]|uniref:BfmA/BtgA family mobilization protein n=1 Tax=Lutibacter sp. A64 TaxID=2918526 RepID=UPI001F06C46F|nr:BfmA/BtgA family mobilization protein [Lutibacter sp. A64]UMB53939.1 hypothetical protein MKD41_00305 [Lutibacter sp. A64]